MAACSRRHCPVEQIDDNVGQCDWADLCDLDTDLDCTFPVRQTKRVLLVEVKAMLVQKLEGFWFDGIRFSAEHQQVVRLH